MKRLGTKIRCHTVAVLIALTVFGSNPSVTLARRVILTIPLTLTLMTPAVGFASTTPTPTPSTSTNSSGSALVNNENVAEWVFISIRK